eukprot:CAMPEP_0197907810 /NCGR_PEP_ID=MMETSP1439-20131203/65516_1 /TAXON_ID=66791 /ORGANISM="Gonyaulax spinifera, Strain CCMP409" /LENGTH=39 /DNA_ID= /DNA_START= /DNA_END= /DNA_ORIENTATION=
MPYRQTLLAFADVQGPGSPRAYSRGQGRQPGAPAAAAGG